MLGLSNAFVPQQIFPGLNITVNAGQIYLGGTGTIISVGTTTVNLTASATNYVYLDYGLSIITANTTGFPGSCYPIATAITNTTSLVSFTDNRVDFSI